MPVPEVARLWAIERQYGAVGEVAIFTCLLSLDFPTIRDLGFRRTDRDLTWLLYLLYVK